jgi:glutathione-independent formaldehyde dehydrogenase
MADNRGVAYIGPGKVELHDIDFPTFELQDGPGVNPANVGRKLPHAAILKCVATNICGSDQHMVRGRTTAPAGMVLGHEITGEVIEKGSDVEMLEPGIFARCRSTSPAAGAGCARPATPACAST